MKAQPARWTRRSEPSYRDGCLRQETFSSLEAQTAVGLCQNAYNRVRPHASLGDHPCP
ncbi:integrase core domain-containing protein [Methylobacterium sp. P31]